MDTENDGISTPGSLPAAPNRTRSKRRAPPPPPIYQNSFLTEPNTESSNPSSEINVNGGMEDESRKNIIVLYKENDPNLANSNITIIREQPTSDEGDKFRNRNDGNQPTNGNGPNISAVAPPPRPPPPKVENVNVQPSPWDNRANEDAKRLARQNQLESGRGLPPTPKVFVSNFGLVSY